MNRLLAISAAIALAGATALGAYAQVPAQPRTARVLPRPKPNTTLLLLNQRLPDVQYTDVPFEQVMEAIKDFTKANVVVRWEKLEDAGVEKDKPITIAVKNLPLSMVLWMIMNEAGGSDVKLAYRASGNLLIVSTEEDLGKEMIVKVYDVTDLLVNVPRFTNAPQIDPSQALSNTGGSGGGGGGNIFQDEGDDEDDDEGDRNALEAPGIRELINLIVATVEPDSWEQNGGTGSITPFRSQLVVRNNILVHQRLNGYIEEE